VSAVPRIVRGIVFEEDVARAIERRLRADGYTAAVRRERLAGEDDDADHPWAVETDAPPAALELLLDAHDGWLDDAPIERRSTAPLDLPDGPRRRRSD